MQQVARGEYVLQRREPSAPARKEEVPTFQLFASLVLDRKRPWVGEKRLKDLEWRLRTAMDHFGKYPLDLIDVALTDSRTTARTAASPSMEGVTRASDTKVFGSSSRALLLHGPLPESIPRGGQLGDEGPALLSGR